MALSNVVWTLKPGTGARVVGTLALVPSLLALNDVRMQTRVATPANGDRGDRIVVAFSDPSRPGMLHVNLVAGGIKVRGYEGKDVVIEALRRPDDEEDQDKKMTGSGLRRIRNTSSGLVVEEANNEMRLSTSMPNTNMDVSIQVPFKTNLKLSAVNDADVTVERVDGEIEVNVTNGGATLTGVSGSVVAHALNDDLTVSMTSVSGKPMSFSSLNGNLDITLPASIKCNVRLESAMGEIYSDFDVEMLPSSAQQTVEDERAKGGKYRVKVEKAMVGRINGGGSEVSFKTFNGDIHIRKAR
jgi:DUF4097 and DUF4098 domain-containing protein YvlB